MTKWEQIENVIQVSGVMYGWRKMFVMLIMTTVIMAVCHAQNIHAGEYPNVILNTRITPDLFEKSRSVHFVKEGWAFYIEDLRIETDNKYLAQAQIFPSFPSYEWYYLFYWENGDIAIIKHRLANLAVGLWSSYDENGDVKEQINQDNIYGDVSPYDVLSILAEEKMIDLKEGKSRRISPSGVRFSFKLSYDENTKIWLADINLDFEKGPEANPVSPFYRKYARYSIDGETGRILDVIYETRYEESEYDEVGAD